MKRDRNKLLSVLGVIACIILGFLLYVAIMQATIQISIFIVCKNVFGGY